MRFDTTIRFLAALAIAFAAFAAQAQAPQQTFAAFVAKLWPDAQAKGISRTTFDLAMQGVTPDQRVIAATKRQPEYGRPFGDYVNAVANKRRIAEGQMQGQAMGQDLRRRREANSASSAGF